MHLQARGGTVVVDLAALEFRRARLLVRRGATPIASIRRRDPLA
jgi:hypothetical protein